MSQEEESIEVEETDRDPSNVVFRAGYIWAMAAKTADPEDRKMLMRASKSLRAYHESITGKRM